MVKPLVPPMVDILGPYVTTPQHVVARPGETGDAAGAGFSWWKDCTDENAEDGTPIPAVALNNFKAQILTFLLAAGAKIDDSDEMLTRGARSRGLNFAIAGGTANALTATLDPVPLADEVVAGFEMTLAVATPNTGAATFDIGDGNGAKAIRRPDLSALVPGDTAGLPTLRFDGTYWLLVSRPVDDYLITTAITKTVYGVSPDFADLAAAFEWLSRRRITTTGSVVLSLPAGSHVLPASVQSFSHPDGQRISIAGAALTGAAPVNSDFTITGNTSGARASDTAAHLTMLQGKFPTRLISAGAGSGLALRRIGLISNILVHGVGGASSPAVQIDEVGSVSNVAVQGAPGPGLIANGRLTLTGNLYLSGCGGHNLTGTGAQITGANVLTYSATLGGSYLAQNSSMAVGVVSARGNGLPGTILQEGSTFGGQAGSIWQSNGGHNFDLDGGCYAHLRSSTIDGGGITPYGIRAVVGSFVQADTCTFGNHTTGPAYAFDSSNIAGKSCTGLGAGATPTVNGGVGNSGSYITNV